MKASLTNHRQAPRKVRIVADTLRGKNVQRALDDLSVMPKKAALPMTKLLRSAVANARQIKSTLSEADLEVATITVDKGKTFVRFMPRAYGRAAPIHRESSHVKLALREVVGGAQKAITKPAPVATNAETKVVRKTVKSRTTKNKSE